MSTVPEILAEDALDPAPDVGSRPRSRVRTTRAPRTWMRAALMATWPALVAGLVALGVTGYQLTLPHALAGVHGYTGYGYDDGVYLGTAIRLVHGVFPYRDYAFVHPPGIALLLTPACVLISDIGSRSSKGSRLTC